MKKSIVEKARMASEKLGFVSAQASLDKLAEIYRDGMSVREAVELQRLKRALQAKTEST